MFSLLGFLLVLAVTVVLGVQIWVMMWKLKIAVKKAVRTVSDNPVAAFAIKIGMFLYFSVVVATVDRVLE